MHTFRALLPHQIPLKRMYKFSWNRVTRTLNFLLPANFEILRTLMTAGHAYAPSEHPADSYTSLHDDMHMEEGFLADFEHGDDPSASEAFSTDSLYRFIKK